MERVGSEAGGGVPAAGGGDDAGPDLLRPRRRGPQRADIYIYKRRGPSVPAALRLNKGVGGVRNAAR